MQHEQELKRFRAFLAQLKGDLRSQQEVRDALLKQVKAYQDLQSNIKLLQEEDMQELSTLAPLGAGVFAKARVPDTSRLLVDVGLGFHAECTLDEALAVASLRLEHLAKRADERNRQVASIKANIALVEQGLAGFPESD